MFSMAGDQKIVTGAPDGYTILDGGAAGVDVETFSQYDELGGDIEAMMATESDSVLADVYVTPARRHAYLEECVCISLVLATLHGGSQHSRRPSRRGVPAPCVFSKTPLWLVAMGRPCPAVYPWRTVELPCSHCFTRHVSLALV